MKREIKFVLKCLVLVIALTIVAGIIYERRGQRQDRKRFTQIGQSIECPADPSVFLEEKSAQRTDSLSSAIIQRG
ncbi:MAG TPA: hypothetical protein VK582_20470 [Pyrinomonadaceae bacterium]|nr:hypothetical protein [Pyrinomonadaceae bacterium]